MLTDEQLRSVYASGFHDPDLPDDVQAWELAGLRAVEAAVRAEAGGALEAQRANAMENFAVVVQLQAVIAEQLRIVSDPVSDYYGEIREKFAALSQSPTDALQAHDRQVAAKAVQAFARSITIRSPYGHEVTESMARLQVQNQAYDYVAALVSESSPVPSTPEQPEGENDEQET